MPDRDITLSIDLDTKDAVQTSKELQEKIEEIFKSDKGQGSAKLTNLNSQLKKTMLQAEEARVKLEEIGSAQVKTDEFAKLEKAFETLDSRADKLKQKAYEFLKAGGSESDKRYIKMAQDIKTADQNLARLLDRLREMQLDGQAFTSGVNTQEYAEQEQKLDLLNDKLKQQLVRHQEITNGVKKTNKELDKSKKKVKETSNALGGLKKGFMTVLKYAFGIRSLYILVRKIREAIKEGFTNLIQHNNGLKQQIDSLKGSLTQLKNSFATAFAPIVEAIIPYIQKLVDWLNILMDKFAQFTAAISGQKAYAKALKQTGDAAEAAGKKAKGGLASFDKLNNITSQDSGGGKQDMFEDVAIDENIIKQIDKIKEELDNVKKAIDKDIIKPFKEGFDAGIGDKWKDKIEDIKKSFAGIKESLTEIFSDPMVQNAVQRFVQKTSYAIGQIVGAGARIGLNLAQGIVGGVDEFLKKDKDWIKLDISDILDIGGDTIALLGDAAQAIGEISEVLGDEEGQGLIGSVLSFLYTCIATLTRLLGLLTLDTLRVIIEPIINNVDKIKESLSLAFQATTTALDTITEKLRNMMEVIIQAYRDYIQPTVDNVIEILSDAYEWILSTFDVLYQWFTEKVADLVGTILDEIGPCVEQIFAFIKEVGDAITLFWKKILVPILNWIRDYIWPVIKKVLDVVVSAVKNAIKIVSNVIQVVFNFIKTTIGAIVSLLTGKPKEALAKFTGFFKDAYNNIKNILQALWDFAKDFVDGFFGMFEKVGEAIGGAVSGIKNFFGGSKTHNGSGRDIPGYASGQVIPPSMSAHLAVLGDNKRETEVVSPLSTIRQAVTEALQGMGNNGQDQTIVINMDGREFMRVMVDRNREYKKQNGGASAFA